MTQLATVAISSRFLSRLIESGFDRLAAGALLYALPGLRGLATKQSKEVLSAVCNQKFRAARAVAALLSPEGLEDWGSESAVAAYSESDFHLKALWWLATRQREWAADYWLDNQGSLNEGPEG